MKISCSLTAAVMLNISLLGAGAAHSAVATYSSEALFLAALGGAPPPITTINYDFDGLTQGDIIASGGTLSGATFTYSLTGGALIMVDDFFDTTSPNNYLGTNDVTTGAFVSGDSFAITFDQTIHAIGLNVITGPIDLFDDDFIVTTNNGQSVGNLSSVTSVLGDGSVVSFLGLIEDDFSNGFNSITLSSLDAGFLFNVDDITVQTVPLPAAAWLFGSALLGLAGLQRRRKCNAIRTLN